jgi:tyrosine-protein kinase Etk/Wzc
MNQQLPAVPQAEEIHLQDYINVVLRRKWSFLVCFLGVLTATVLYTFLVPPSYESTATLFVKDDKGKMGQMGDLLLNAAAPVDSELEILRSRSNAEKVVSALHLNWKIDKRSGAVGCTLLEFSSSVTPPVYRIELVGADSYNVKDSDGNTVGTGTSGFLMRGRGVSLFIKDLRGKQGDSFRLTLLPFNDTVERLRKQIKVAEVGKKTNVMSVTYRNHDRVRARDVVNTLVQAYLEQGVAIKAEEATRTVGFVEDQLKGVKNDLEMAEKNLQSYKSASGIIQLDSEAQTIIGTLSDAEKEKADIALQRKQAEFALGSLKDARSRGTVYSPAVLRNDPLVAGLASRLADLEVQKKGLLAETTDNHPAVRNVQAQIDEVQRKIQSTYESAITGLAKNEGNVGRQIAGYDAQLKRLPVAERDLARLLRLTKVNADIYTFLLQKHEEARIAKASTISNIKVVDPAITADRPVSPKKAKNLLLGILVGLMAGVAVCFFRDYLDDTLKDPEQSKKALALPMLAVIPYISNKNGLEGMISHHSPKAPASEAFRALRTGLHFAALKREKKVMLVTSSFSGEGKSVVAANLAITLAQTGARVLAVDCDLRRPTLHEKFDLERGDGLTEVLACYTPVSAALQFTAVENLDVLMAGSTPPNPSEMLGSEAMRQFIEEMKGLYDHIIMDAPPVLAVTDAAVLTQFADQVLVVLETGRVPVKAAQRTKDMLLAAAAPIAGFVISERTASAMVYGYGYGYGYGYTDEVDSGKRSWFGFARKG